MKVVVKITWIKDFRSLALECLVFQSYSLKSVGDILISLGHMLKKEKEERYDTN